MKKSLSLAILFLFAMTLVGSSVWADDGVSINSDEDPPLLMQEQGVEKVLTPDGVWRYSFLYDNGFYYDKTGTWPCGWQENQRPIEFQDPTYYCLGADFWAGSKMTHYYYGAAIKTLNSGDFTYVTLQYCQNAFQTCDNSEMQTTDFKIGFKFTKNGQTTWKYGWAYANPDGWYTQTTIFSPGNNYKLEAISVEAFNDYSMVFADTGISNSASCPNYTWGGTANFASWCSWGVQFDDEDSDYAEVFPSWWNPGANYRHYYVKLPWLNGKEDNQWWFGQRRTGSTTWDGCTTYYDDYHDEYTCMIHAPGYFNYNWLLAWFEELASGDSAAKFSYANVKAVKGDFIWRLKHTTAVYIP